MCGWVRQKHPQSSARAPASFRHFFPSARRCRTHRIRPAQHHRVPHADDRRRRAVACGDLLERDRQRQVVHRGAAPLFRHDDARRTDGAPARAVRCGKNARRGPSGRRSARSCSCANARTASRTKRPPFRVFQQHAAHPVYRRVSSASFNAIAATPPPRTQRRTAAHAGCSASRAGDARWLLERTGQSPAALSPPAVRRGTTTYRARCRAPGRQTAGRARDRKARTSGLRML